MTNRKRGLYNSARKLSQGDPSLGNDNTAVFQPSCNTVSISMATNNPAASLIGNFFLVLISYL